MSETKPLHAPLAAQSEWAASRERGYGFLAWLFLETPDSLFLQRMLGAEVGAYLASLAASEDADPVMIAGLEEMRGWLAARAHQPLEQLRQDLAVQMTRLLKGVAPGYGPPPPYEAVYRRLGAGVDVETLLSIRRFYREAGADLPPTSRERLDHLGMELDFMRFLCGEESGLWLSGAADAATRYRRIQRRFLANHLMPWVPGYCQRVPAEPCVPFFHGVARALAGFLAGEARLLDRWADAEEATGHPDPASIP